MFSVIILLFFFKPNISLPAQEINLTPLLNNINQIQEKSHSLSPDLKIVRALKSQKSAETFTRITDFFPQAYFSVKKNRDFFEERNIQLRELGLSPLNSTWAIDYNWTLFNYGLLQSARKSFNEKNKAELELQSKEKQYPISFNSNLLNLLLSKYKKAAIENSLKKAETGKKEASLGFELGQKTKLDVLRSEANMVSLDSKKMSFIDEEQNSTSRFLEFSGLDSQDINFLNNLDESIILSLINAIAIPAIQLTEPKYESSPLLETLDYEEKINSLSLAGLTATQMPELKLQGSFNNSGETYNQTFHNPYRTHSVALILTIPLFGGGNFVSSQFEDFYARKQVEYTMKQKRQETQNQLKNSLIKINALEKMVSSLNLNVSQYEELYRLTLKSYQLGKSSLLELLEVQDNLLDSKISLAQNKIQYYSLSQNYLWQAGIK